MIFLVGMGFFGVSFELLVFFQGLGSFTWLSLGAAHGEVSGCCFAPLCVSLLVSINPGYFTVSKGHGYPLVF
jgi:hypothetical protein